MPKVGGKRKKTKTHEEQEEIDSSIPQCKYLKKNKFLKINLNFYLYSNNYKAWKSW